jgi:hypothetical protein
MRCSAPLPSGEHVKGTEFERATMLSKNVAYVGAIGGAGRRGDSPPAVV